MESYSTWLERNKLLSENTHYYRIPENVIGNEFYLLQREAKEMYQSLKSGSDLNVKYWEKIKKLVSDIDKSIKKERV